MGFAGVYTAIYDYSPQAENELEIAEGDLLYVLDKTSDDGWWKAKRKARDVDGEEPIGLVPNNYVEEANPTQTARSLYDYTRQTDEEVSFSEDAELKVFDTSDPDWTLVQINSEYGFAPSNYIELTAGTTTAAATAPPPALPPQKVDRSSEPEELPTPPSDPSPAVSPIASPATSPAAALAGILNKQHESISAQTRAPPAPPSEPSRPSPTALTPQGSDEDDASPPPALPQRPISHPGSPQEPLSPPPDEIRTTYRDVPAPRLPYSPLQAETSPGIRPSPPYNRIASKDSAVSPSGYHIYNISEMISIMGKRKKMPTTLGINLATGTIFISPEHSDDGPHQEWTADRLKHYSIEGKHVFLDLVRPSKSVDFHAGAKDTAQEIVSALGEIAGGYRAEGLREVIAAGMAGAKKKGHVLYDFMAQGDDEVTVAVGDEVVILDDSKSEEWWMVRRLKNGQEGVVPSSYVEITGVMDPTETSFSGLNAGLSTVEQNRREEDRLAREALKHSRRHDSAPGDAGSSAKHPNRASSLFAHEESNKRSQRNKQKPDPSKTRKWTDRTGTFTVVAQFIGLTDGKIHLHKQNGIKIAVPVSKMSIEDLEYVEQATGESLDEDKPLSDIRRRSLMQPEKSKRIGASISKEPEYDWFDFFLKAGVGHHLCERYAQNFAKDSMDENILPEITSSTLRTLGLREGDNLRVMKYLDEKYNRKSKSRNVTFGGEEVIGTGEDSGGLFSGPGGALRNNTRKGRPAPPVQTSDVVDPKAFSLKDSSKSASPTVKDSTGTKTQPTGFEDSAWEVNRPKTPPGAKAPPSVTVTQAQTQPALTGAMADLSLLQDPLQPSKPTPSVPQASQPPTSQSLQSAPQPAAPQQPSMTGANPAFFSQLGQPAMTQAPQMPALNTQMTGFAQSQQPQQNPQYQIQQLPMPPRQRPQPPAATNQGSLLPPPPQRPLSAPNNPSTLGPAPLQPQLTGLPQNTPHLAPPGHSLAELNQQRFQQLQPQPTGFTSLGPYGNQMVPQTTGMPMQQQGSFMGGPQQTGFQGMIPQQTGYPAFSPPQGQQFLSSALQPQQTGVNGFGRSHIAELPGSGNFRPVAPSVAELPTSANFRPPPPPAIPELPAAPLQPQKTGPAPPVRFGVQKDTKKLTPQPTGLKANLAQATPSNPFGF